MALTVVKRLICKECQQPIEPRTGVIIQGNVYVVGADPNARGGIIGNAIKEEPIVVVKVDDAKALEQCYGGAYEHLGSALQGCAVEIAHSVIHVDEVAFHYHCLRKLLRQHLEPTDE